MYSRSEFDDDDLRREDIDARRRAYHWCDTCHGHTGPDSPCYSGPDPEPEGEAQVCETCEGVGTIDERLSGYSFSNPAATCPDCEGTGEVRITRSAP